MEKMAPREKYRAQVRAEIKDGAWEQLATSGTTGLSLNAIAKRMGMSGPALYRYFASRDDLITELIRDAYRSLADTVQATEPELGALAAALRGWALGDPQRYFLIYGTPVPGYHAPADITGIAGEIMTVLLQAAVAADSHDDTGAEPSEFAQHLDQHRRWAPDDAAPPAALHRALTFWTRLHGVLSLELAGHFTGMEFDVAQLYAAEVERLTAS